MIRSSHSIKRIAGVGSPLSSPSPSNTRTTVWRTNLSRLSTTSGPAASIRRYVLYIMLKLMNFVSKMMNFVLKMMYFVLKMMKVPRPEEGAIDNAASKEAPWLVEHMRRGRVSTHKQSPSQLNLCFHARNGFHCQLKASTHLQIIHNSTRDAVREIACVFQSSKHLRRGWIGRRREWWYKQLPSVPAETISVQCWHERNHPTRR